ncbi:MAG: hypothetical protein ABIW19_14550 [Vicinamibacterales bacterium]
MTATLIPITDEQRAPSARLERLYRRVVEASAALSAAIQTHEDNRELVVALERYRTAEINVRIYWEGQAKRAERRLRDILAAEMSDEQRAQTMAALHGPVEGRRRNVHVLNPYEREVLDYYRKIGSKDRTMIRLLFERLAETPEAGPE